MVNAPMVNNFMELNARINWQPGMELTAQTFLDMDAGLDFRQQMAVRAALGEHCLGLIPGLPFDAKGAFHANSYEINHLQLTAVLPSGRIIQVDEPVEIPIPLLYGAEYYLTIGFSGSTTSYEKNNVPYIRPQYIFSILTETEMRENDVFPIVKFNGKDGIFAVNSSYIPPCLLLSCYDAFDSFRQQYADLLRTLAEHPHLKEGDGKRMMMRYFFLIKSYDMQGRVADFIRLTHEIAQAIDYFIMQPNTTQEVSIPHPQQHDVEKWLQWLVSYLTGAVTVLEDVELEDDSIDYEALLEQAKKELYERLNPELYEKLLRSIKDELREELGQTLRQTLTEYMNDTLKPELEQRICDNLHELMYDKLYNELYERLYNALYVPEEEEADFIPII